MPTEAVSAIIQPLMRPPASEAAAAPEPGHLAAAPRAQGRGLEVVLPEAADRRGQGALEAASAAERAALLRSR